MIAQSEARKWLATLADESVDLVATDPPYNTGNDFGDYDDRYNRDEYLAMMREVITHLRRVLKPTGSMYLQCDWHMDAELRLLCDDVFGRSNFRNAVIWPRSHQIMNSQHAPKRMSVMTDTIFLYAKSPDAKLRPYIPMTNEFIVRQYPCVEEDGRRYNWQGKLGHLGFRLLSGRTNMFEYRGFKPPANGWRLTAETMDELFERGDIALMNGRLKRKQHQPEEGLMIGSLWSDIEPINTLSNARVGYATQKPIALYERMISFSSVEGDLVIDPFCGSGTTLLAAKRLQRRWAGCDVNPKAVAIATKRICEQLL